jgi:hypothetical protein
MGMDNKAETQAATKASSLTRREAIDKVRVEVRATPGRVRADRPATATTAQRAGPRATTVAAHRVSTEA